MHMADALVSPLVAGVMGIVSGTLLIIATKKTRNSQRENIVPLMGVMGAFIFVTQMINFSIPGTGSSGHIVGGVLLATLLGPWPALITLSSVLFIQCLLFADGGFMALGCNIFNMAVCTCLIAYPLIFNPLIKNPSTSGRIIWLSVITCVFGLELGAVAVTLETEASNITALPLSQFLVFMTSIHLFIGIGEGLATAAILYFVQKYKPELLLHTQTGGSKKIIGFGKALIIFALVTFLFGISFQWLASSDPDGLEWSILRITGSTELPVVAPSEMHEVVHNIQKSTSLIPDYGTNSAGIIGGIIVVLLIWGSTSLIRLKKKNTLSKNGFNENAD